MISCGGSPRDHMFLIEGEARYREDDDRARISDGGPARAKNASTSRCPKPSGNCGLAPPRMAGRSTSVSKYTSCCRRRACSIRTAAEPALFLRSRTGRNDQADLCGGRSCAAAAGGAGQPFRNPAAGAEFAALPPPILAIKHYFANFGATVLLLDDMSSDLGDKTIHSVAHGVLRLEELAPAYGAERRRARVIKYRGVKFRGGYP